MIYVAGRQILKIIRTNNLQAAQLLNKLRRQIIQQDLPVEEIQIRFLVPQNVFKLPAVIAGRTADMAQKQLAK